MKSRTRSGSVKHETTAKKAIMTTNTLTGNKRFAHTGGDGYAWARLGKWESTRMPVGSVFKVEL